MIKIGFDGAAIHRFLLSLRGTPPYGGPAKQKDHLMTSNDDPEVPNPVTGRMACESPNVSQVSKPGTDEPFGRQPQPVKVTLEGEQIDVEYYRSRLIRAAESHGEFTVRAKDHCSFTIYPRAVND